MRSTDLSFDEVSLKHHVGIVSKYRSIQFEIKVASVEVVAHHLARLLCEATQLSTLGKGPLEMLEEIASIFRRFLVLNSDVFYLIDDGLQLVRPIPVSRVNEHASGPGNRHEGKAAGT